MGIVGSELKQLPDPSLGLLLPIPPQENWELLGGRKEESQDLRWGKSGKKDLVWLCSQEFPPKKDPWIGNNGLEIPGIKGGNSRVGMQAEAQDKINPS